MNSSQDPSAAGIDTDQSSDFVNELARWSLTAAAEAQAAEQRLAQVSGWAKSSYGRMVVGPSGEIRDLMLRDAAPAAGADGLRTALLELYLEASARANRALAGAVPELAEPIRQAPPEAIRETVARLESIGEPVTELAVDAAEVPRDATVHDLPADPEFDRFAESFGGPIGVVPVGDPREVLVGSPVPLSGMLDDPAGFDDRMRREIAALTAAGDALERRMATTRGTAETRSMVVTVTPSGSLDNVVFGSSVGQHTATQLQAEFMRLYRAAVSHAGQQVAAILLESPLSEDPAADAALFSLAYADPAEPAEAEAVPHSGRVHLADILDDPTDPSDAEGPRR